MGFFMPMKRNPLLLFLIIILTSCGNNEGAKLAPEENLYTYSNFTDFPNCQFNTIQLGDDLSETENKIIQIGGKEMAIEESLYYWIKADSTEIIIPNRTKLSTFKVFLKSAQYLNNEANFKEFLTKKATRITENDFFSVFYFETNLIPFKLTYFLQSTYIRLNFTLLVLDA